MGMSWLVPIIREEPLTFGAKRLALDGPLVLDFINKLSTIHPRCLMSFKAQLLLTDESEEACGGSDRAIDWGNRQDITMNGMLILSHCAEAFIDCIPQSEEIVNILGSLVTSDWDEAQQDWLNQMKQWLGSGYRVIMMREA